MNIDFMGKRKELSEEDKQAADRLHLLWLAHKRKYGQSQIEIAEQLGVTQSAFGQYINGIVPINLEMALKIATVFGVHVSSIKQFSSLDGYHDYFGMRETSDKHTSAILRSLDRLDNDARARVRGVVEGYLLDVIDKKTAEKDKELPNFQARLGAQ